MQLSKATMDLLASLDTLSLFKLTRRGDLGVLLELSALNKQHDVLDELSFVAKFVSKTLGIMTRIGKDGNGYEKLAREFTETVGKAKVLVERLLESAPASIRQQFSSMYLNMNTESLQNLVALCYDLSWYKNWLIDNPGQRRSRVQGKPG